MAKFLSSTFKSSDLLRSSQIFMGSSGRPRGRCRESAADRTFCAWTSISRSDILIAGANQLSSALLVWSSAHYAFWGSSGIVGDPSSLESTFNAYHSNSVNPHLFVLEAFEGLYSVRTIGQLSGSMGGGSRLAWDCAEKPSLVICAPAQPKY